MSQSKLIKADIIQSLKLKFAEAKSVVIVDYRGLTVAQVSDLRRKLKESGGELLVAKNTLILRALDNKVTKELTEALNGPTAVVFSPDELSSSKIIASYAKSAGLPKVKVGLTSDRVLTAAEVAVLATIPRREVLNGKLVGLLVSQPTRLVWTLSGNFSKLGRTLE